MLFLSGGADEKYRELQSELILVVNNIGDDWTFIVRVNEDDATALLLLSEKWATLPKAPPAPLLQQTTALRNATSDPRAAADDSSDVVMIWCINLSFV